MRAKHGAGVCQCGIDPLPRGTIRQRKEIDAHLPTNIKQAQKAGYLLCCSQIERQRITAAVNIDQGHGAGALNRQQPPFNGKFAAHSLIGKSFKIGFVQRGTVDCDRRPLASQQPCQITRRKRIAAQYAVRSLQQRQ